MKDLGGIFRQRVVWAMAALVLVVFVGSVNPGGGTPAEAQTAVEAGYQGYSFGSNVSSPTAEKPQSKLWFNDGSWWGVLWDPGAGEYRIHRFDRQSNSWSDTGTLVDKRHNAKADALWDGNKLYVATAPVSDTTTDQGAYVLRYSYDPQTRSYSLDANFPARVASGVIEAIVMDKDTTGRLWATYTQGGRVYVNNSQGSDASWGTSFALPVKGASNLDPDDIAAVVAFDGQIGVMWSNQVDDAIYFATHLDGDPAATWQESRTAVMGPKSTDNHINLKSVQADSRGRIYAAVKTSFNDGSDPNPNHPLIYLLERDTLGNWNSYTFGRVQDNHTRPIVVIDEQNRNLHMFATAPVSPGGVIYHKQTSLDAVSFEEGLGTPFIKSSADTTINNATSTKQSVNGTTDLLVLAADDTSDRYLHNTIDLPGTKATAPETTIDSGPSGTVTSASTSFGFSSTSPDSTFECSLDGGPYAGCASPMDYVNLPDGAHTFSVRATDGAGNADPTPATRSWRVDATAPAVGGVSPADGATGVYRMNNVEATFSEAMDPATITASTFTLTKQGDATPTAATVTYDPDTNKATLDPNDYLEAGATYAASLRGGSGGARDTAGNPLSADRAWSFTATASADLTAPTVQPPAERFSTKQLATTSIPVQINWTATDGSAIEEYRLQRSTDGGAFTDVALSSATSVEEVPYLTPGKTYQFRVRARDAAGNWSDWAVGPSFIVGAFQETDAAIAYNPSSAWTQESLSGAYGGGVKYATVKGDTATFAFTGREVAWVSSMLPDRGKADVWVDGSYVKTVDLYNKTERWRRVAFSKSWGTSGTHTIEVRVSGTAGRPRVDLDAFLTVR